MHTTSMLLSRYDSIRNMFVLELLVSSPDRFSKIILNSKKCFLLKICLDIFSYITRNWRNVYRIVASIGQILEKRDPSLI
jgi:hypothetical protein